MVPGRYLIYARARARFACRLHIISTRASICREIRDNKTRLYSLISIQQNEYHFVHHCCNEGPDSTLITKKRFRNQAVAGCHMGTVLGAARATAMPGGDLPPNWVEKESSKRPGKTYFYNTVTRESLWERPKAEAQGKAGGKDKKRPAAAAGGGDKKPRGPTVQCLHILKKHTGSRNPLAHGNPVTRTKEQAVGEIEKLRHQVVVAGDIKAMRAKFEELAKTESDCSSGKRGGDLGPFGRGQMQKAFEEPAFRMEVRGVCWCLRLGALAYEWRRARSVNRCEPLRTAVNRCEPL